MALQNGNVTGSLLFGAAGTSGATLRFGSANRWGKIRAEVLRRYGWAPEITSAGDGYRTLERQIVLFKRNYTTTNTGVGGPKFWDGSLWWRRTASTPSAATPGTSNHGYGTTVDVVNLGTLNQFGTTRYNQFADVATEHGFSNAEGRSIGEPWHWSDTLDPDDALDGTKPSGGGSLPAQEYDVDLSNPADRQAMKVVIAETLSEALGNMGGGPAGWWKSTTKAIVAETLREAVGDLVPATGWGRLPTTALATAATHGTAAIKTDTALIKGGVGTIIDLLNAGAAARPPVDGGDVDTTVPGLSDEDVERIADAVLARLANIAVTITPEVGA